MKMLPAIRRALWTAVAIFAAVNVALIFWTDRRNPGGSEQAVSGRGGDIRPEFELTDHTGRRVTARDYRGKWLLVFFGFTNCPDICPTTLGEIAGVVSALGPLAAEVRPLFVSIDPTRDRVPDIARYVAAFHPAIVGLTGSESDIAAVAKSFRVYYEKVARSEAAPGDYTMAHTTATYLVDPEGRFDRVYAYGTSAEDIAGDLKKRMENPP